MKAKKPKTKEILNSYLMWVGAEHYADIKTYADEAVAHGISKRMPTVEMATKLAEPGSVVFLAHDEGEYKDCRACHGEMECGECRKLDGKIEAAKEELKALREEELAEGESPALAKKLARLKASVKEIAKEMKGCKLCKGTGTHKGGTGGLVCVNDDAWDYRRYNYWLHQPKKWSPAGKLVEEHMCEKCGGTGRLPEGKVFGLFLPSDVEWIVPEGTPEKVKAEMKKRGFKLVPEKVLVKEPRRGCGKRRPGGVYITTKPDGDLDAKGEAILAELIESGAVVAEGVEVSGSFVRFIEPVAIDSKRFRGVKRWSLDPKAEREAEMILDAMDGAEA